MHVTKSASISCAVLGRVVAFCAITNDITTPLVGNFDETLRSLAIVLNTIGRVHEIDNELLKMLLLLADVALLVLHEMEYMAFEADVRQGRRRQNKVLRWGPPNEGDRYASAEALCFSYGRVHGLTPAARALCEKASLQRNDGIGSATPVVLYLLFDVFKWANRRPTGAANSLPDRCSAVARLADLVRVLMFVRIGVGAAAHFVPLQAAQMSPQRAVGMGLTLMWSLCLGPRGSIPTLPSGVFRAMRDSAHIPRIAQLDLITQIFAHSSGTVEPPRYITNHSLAIETPMEFLLKTNSIIAFVAIMYASNAGQSWALGPPTYGEADPLRPSHAARLNTYDPRRGFYDSSDGRYHLGDFDRANASEWSRVMERGFGLYRSLQGQPEWMEHGLTQLRHAIDITDRSAWRGLSPIAFVQNIRHDMLHILPHIGFLFANWQAYLIEKPVNAMDTIEDLLDLIEPSLLRFFSHLGQPYMKASSMTMTRFDQRAQQRMNATGELSVQEIQGAVRLLDANLMRAFRATKHSFGETNVANRFSANHFVTYLDKENEFAEPLGVPISPATRVFSSADFPPGTQFPLGMTPWEQMRLALNDSLTQETPFAQIDPVKPLYTPHEPTLPDRQSQVNESAKYRKSLAVFVRSQPQERTPFTRIDPTNTHYGPDRQSQVNASANDTEPIFTNALRLDEPRPQDNVDPPAERAWNADEMEADIRTRQGVNVDFAGAPIITALAPYMEPTEFGPTWYNDVVAGLMLLLPFVQGILSRHLLW